MVNYGVRQIAKTQILLVTLLSSITIVCWSLSAQADIYVYRNFYGRMTFSDRPLTQPGYELTKRIYTKSTAPLSTPSTALDDLPKAPKGRTSVANLDHQIRKAARSYALDPALIKAVIHVESHFNPNAISRVGARGLMQIMPGTGEQYDVQNLFNPKENIRAGSQHLSYLLKKYNYNLDLALAAYNAGEARITQYGGVPPYKETQDYVRKVKHAQEQYRLAISEGSFSQEKPSF